MSQPISVSLRAKGKKLQADAQAIYQRASTSGEAMSDADAATYDGLLDQRDTAFRQADEAELREKRFNAAAALASGDADPASGFADLPHNDAKNTRNGRHGYSVLKALRQNVEAREGSGRLDGLELEVHNELLEIRRANGGGKTKGVLVPLDLACSPRELRALDTTAGAGSIATILSTSLIDILRARLVVVSMGARVMSGMRGLFDIPKKTASGTGYWVAEGSAPTGSNQTIGQVPFSPKTAAGYTDFTRRFVLEQTSLDAEAFVRQDLMDTLARTVELAALDGTGSSGQPEGLSRKSGIGDITIGTDGGNPTWATIVGMETSVATGNADVGSMGYVFNAATRGYLKQAPKIGTTFPSFLWDANSPDTPVNGYKVGITNLLPSNITKGGGTNLSLGLFGNFDDLILALWSGVDLLTDPFSLSSAGSVRVTAFQDCDVNIRNAASFCKCDELKTV